MRTTSVFSRTFIAATALFLGGIVAANAAPKSGARHPRKTRVVRSSRSSAAVRARAWKRLKDYNYVKHFGPISGPMYRSTKW